jgi:hypothetical protein
MAIVALIITIMVVPALYIADKITSKGVNDGSVDE